MHLIQKSKFGVIFLWVFAPGIRVFLDQEHISFLTLKGNDSLVIINVLLRSAEFLTNCNNNS